MADKAVTKEDIKCGLTDLGLQRGDVVVVHSSLSSFGNVDGGAETLLAAILEIIGSTGTLVAPTFNDRPGMFDPASTPSTCGAVTETVRKRPDAVRSIHPTHSVAAIGAFAPDIVEGHEQVHAFGRGSPLFKTLQLKGKILQLGTTHTSNSMVHVAEEIAGVGYLDRSRQMKFRMSTGELVTKWIRRPGCSVGFNAIEDELQMRGKINEIQIGECRARLMTARDVVDTAVEAMKSDPEALLCDRPDCGACAEARATLTALQIQEQDREIIELAEEDERTVRLIEKRLNGPVTYFDPDSFDQSPN